MQTMWSLTKEWILRILLQPREQIISILTMQPRGLEWVSSFLTAHQHIHVYWKILLKDGTPPGRPGSVTWHFNQALPRTPRHSHLLSLAICGPIVLVSVSNSDVNIRKYWRKWPGPPRSSRIIWWNSRSSRRLRITLCNQYFLSCLLLYGRRLRPLSVSSYSFSHKYQTAAATVTAS